MKQGHFNLTAEAWQTLRRTWQPRWSPALAWQSHISGSLLSKSYELQQRETADLRARGNLQNALIVLGYWRSGTTLLHELLAASGTWAYPTTNACMNPQTFALNAGKVDLSVSVRRPMDNMIIRGDSPQEDDFAMLGLGGRSPYEALLFPQHMAGALQLCDPAQLSTEECALWQSRFRDFLRTVSGLAGGKKLLLKSPPHSCRISLLQQILPGCRFVLIVRNPYEVFESTVRMWRTMMTCYALEPVPPEEEIRRIVLEHRPGFEACLRAGLSDLAPEQCVTIRFEDLIARPGETIAQIHNALKTGEAEVAVRAATAEMARRTQYRKQAAAVPDPWRAEVATKWRDIFAFCGYAP